MRDYQLHTLSEDEFEKLVYHLCVEILGTGTVAFSKGKDGGRDGRFEGTAERYPSVQAPWTGTFVIQAKHTKSPVARCSDGDFRGNKSSVLNKEKPKMRRLCQAGEVDCYLLFTNRRMGGDTDAAIHQELKDETGISCIGVLGLESITELLNHHPAVVRHAGLDLFGGPIRFNSNDIKRVILAFRKTEDGTSSGLSKPREYKYVEMDRKNEINKLREGDFKFITEQSEAYFAQIRDFLGNPVNENVAEMYEDFAAELNNKVHLHRDDFAHFYEVIEHLYDKVVAAEPDLRPRRLVRIFLHFMYVHCDLGRK